jgi:hypothetical protein
MSIASMHTPRSVPPPSHMCEPMTHHHICVLGPLLLEGLGMPAVGLHDTVWAPQTDPALLPCPTEACISIGSERCGDNMGLDGGCGWAGQAPMSDIWEAAWRGDVDVVEWMVGQDPGLLNAQQRLGGTPLMRASSGGRVGVVSWLLDNGAALDEQDSSGRTALNCACIRGKTPVVKLLLYRGADPSTPGGVWGSTPLIRASEEGHLEVVRCLLANPRAKATLNHRDRIGKTALMGGLL